MSDPYIGEIRLGGWNFAPNGWAFCDGSTLAISQNETLFNLIGTTYGGNGQTTFQLPNLLGRLPLHVGTGAGATYVLGQSSGTETVTLTTAQIPAHSHAAMAVKGPGTADSPSGRTWAGWTGAPYVPGDTGTQVSLANNAIQLFGGGQPHTNLMPTQAITFVIALSGVYPSEN